MKTSLSVERDIIVKEDFRKLEISWLWPCIESSSTMYLGPSERSMMELLAKMKAVLSQKVPLYIYDRVRNTPLQLIQTCSKKTLKQSLNVLCSKRDVNEKI